MAIELITKIKPAGPFKIVDYEDIDGVPTGFGGGAVNVIDLEAEGLALDGITDDGPAFNALLTYWSDPARDGGVWFVKPPTATQLATSVPLVITGRNINLDFGLTSFVAKGAAPILPWAPFEIIWIGSANSDAAVIDIYPTLGFSPAGLKISGIHINCNSLAGYGLRVRSTRKAHFDVVVSEPRTVGVYMGTLDNATADNLNTQDITGDFIIQRENNAFPADGFVFDGVQDPTKSGNASFNIDINSIQGTSAAGGDFVKFKASDNNKVNSIRHWGIGTRVGNNVNTERTLVFEGTNSSTKPTHARFNTVNWLSHSRKAGLSVFEGSAKWSFRAAMHNTINIVDTENGTPAPINEPGTRGCSFGRRLGQPFQDVIGKDVPKTFKIHVGGRHDIFLDQAEPAILDFEISGPITTESYIETYVRVVQDMVGGRTLGTPILNNNLGGGGQFEWIDGAPILNSGANQVTHLKFITVTQQFVSTRLPNTVYAVGQRAVRDINTQPTPVYVCVQAGTSGPEPTHPFGDPATTGSTLINDGTVQWQHRNDTSGRRTYGMKLIGKSTQFPSSAPTGVGNPPGWTILPNTWTDISLSTTDHPIVIDGTTIPLAEASVSYVRLQQNAAGGCTVTWSYIGGGSHFWDGGVAPQATSNANSWDLIEIRQRRLPDGTRRSFGRKVMSAVSQDSGSGVTNLSLGARTETTVAILSDTGTDVTIPPVSTTEAGLMTAADKARFDRMGVHVGAIAEDSGPPAKFLVPCGTTSEITLSRNDHIIEIDCSDLPFGAHTVTRLRIIKTNATDDVVTYQASVSGVLHTSIWSGNLPPPLPSVNGGTAYVEVLTRRSPSTGGAASYWHSSMRNFGDRGSGWDSVESRVHSPATIITLVPGCWNEVTLNAANHEIVVPDSAAERNAITTRLKLVQGSGGSKEVTTWTNIDQWAGGSAPDLRTTAGEWDLIEFVNRNSGGTHLTLGIWLASG